MKIESIQKWGNTYFVFCSVYMSFDSMNFWVQRICFGILVGFFFIFHYSFKIESTISHFLLFFINYKEKKSLQFLQLIKSTTQWWNRNLTTCLIKNILVSNVHVYLTKSNWNVYFCVNLTISKTRLRCWTDAL